MSAITSSTDSQSRADALTGLVRDMYETTCWLPDGSGVSASELDSLARVVAAAEAHQQRTGTLEA